VTGIWGCKESSRVRRLQKKERISRDVTRELKRMCEERSSREKVDSGDEATSLVWKETWILAEDWI
jgi:hypothetical protein